MATCPNKSLESWKSLEASLGEDMAYYLWDKYEGNVPEAKEGVLEVFKTTPELANIGTPQQYSEYLDTVFPNSKVKDIVYHGSSEKIKTKFNDSLTEDGNFFKGIFFSNSLNYIKQLGEKFKKDTSKITPVVINSIDNFQVEEPLQYDSGQYWYFEQYDSVQGKDAGQEVEGNVFAVRSPEQIHILGSKQDVEQFEKFVESGKSTMSQQQGTESSKASPKVLSFTKDLLKRIGVDIKTVNKIVVNGQTLDDNAVAQLMQKLVQVVDGKQDVALTEEAMHFVVAIIKQTNPALYKKLMSEINNYAIKNQVFDTYSTNPSYQTPDGKPDVIKLKEEAIAKLLTEKIILQVEGSTEKPELMNKVNTWWENIIDWIKSLFIKSGFDRTAMDILSGKMEGTAEDIQEGGEFFQQAAPNKQKQVVDKINDTHSKLAKKNVIENGVETEKYFFNGSEKPVKTRISDIINNYYIDLFGDNQMTESEFEKAVFSVYAEKGTDGHADQEHLLSLFTDDNGFALKDANGNLIEKEDKVYKTKLGNEAMYKLLKDNMRKRIQLLEARNPGSVYLAEKQIYDPKYDKAGTIDLMVITPAGKVNIYDWKFMNMALETEKDVPWYKVGAWNKQMSQYKMILQNNYGVSNNEFLETQMVPIIAEYSKPNKAKNLKPVLLKIKIGDLDLDNIYLPYKNEEQKALLPVGLSSENIPNKELGAVVKKLLSLHEKMSSTKAITPEEKLSKAEQLNTLYDAIRQLRMRENVEPLIEQFATLNKRISALSDFYNETFKGVDPFSLNEKQINSFAGELNKYSVTLEYTYSGLSIDLSSLFDKELTDKDKQLQEDLAKASQDAQVLTRKIDKLSGEFLENIIAKRERIDDFITAEQVIKGLPKFFSSTSTLQTNAMQWLFLKTNKLLKFSGDDTIAETDKLKVIREKYLAWAKSKGFNNQTMFDFIKKKDKNELIDQFDTEFYKTIKAKVKEQDFAWIKDNINVEEYKKLVDEELKRELDHIATKPRFRSMDHPITIAQINGERDKAMLKYNITDAEGYGWLQLDLLKKQPALKWESDAWKELNKPENTAAKEFYNYIIERNKFFQSIGYIEYSSIRKFLPFVKKSFAEKLVLGGKISLGEQFLRNITVEPGDIGYGDRDAESGKLINRIPKYLSKDTGQEMSTDLFRTMALMNDMAIRYAYFDEVEQQAVLINRIENNKEAIETSYFGNTKLDEDGNPVTVNDNSQNAKLYESHMNAILYGHKYVADANFDAILGKLGNFGARLNEKLGLKIFPENLTGRQISLNKSIDWITNLFVTKSLAFSPTSTISTFFGGSFQSIINAGKYYTKTDFISKEFMLASMMFGKDSKKYLGAIKYFLPLTEDYNKELAKQLSLSKFSQENVQEFLMSWMRNADKAVQLMNFFAFLDNTVVIDDQVVNARVYVRNSEKYANLYDYPQAEREKLEKEFEEEVKALIEEKGVLKLAEVEGDTFTIPGVEQKSQSVVDVRRTVQQLTKDAIGNLSPEDVRSINFTLQGKSFMTFKGWIPRLVDVRFGDLKYNAGSRAYEWGRSRMIFEMLFKDLSGSINSLKGMFTGSKEEWIAQAKSSYENKRAQYKKETGKELKMSEREFIDMLNQNVRSQMVDVIFYLTLTGLYLALHSLESDNDDEPDKAMRNRYKYLMRMVDKIRDEVAYFYNPTQFISLTSSGIFPPLSYLTNLQKALGNTLTEMYAIGVGDEKLQDKNKVIKYYLKGLPVASQADAVLLMFFPDIAKDLGMRAQSESRPVGR